MYTNEIIDEIHRHRAEHARRCNFDIDVIFAEMRKDLERLKSELQPLLSTRKTSSLHA